MSTPAPVACTRDRNLSSPIHIGNNRGIFRSELPLPQRFDSQLIEPDMRFRVMHRTYLPMWRKETQVCLDNLCCLLIYRVPLPLVRGHVSCPPSINCHKFNSNSPAAHVFLSCHLRGADNSPQRSRGGLPTDAVESGGSDAAQMRSRTRDRPCPRGPQRCQQGATPEPVIGA